MHGFTQTGGHVGSHFQRRQVSLLLRGSCAKQTLLCEPERAEVNFIVMWSDINGGSTSPVKEKPQELLRTAPPIYLELVVIKSRNAAASSAAVNAQPKSRCAHSKLQDSSDRAVRSGVGCLGGFAQRSMMKQKYHR